MFERRYLRAGAFAAALGFAFELHWQLALNVPVLKPPAVLTAVAVGVYGAAATFALFWCAAAVLSIRRPRSEGDGRPLTALCAAVGIPQLAFLAYHLLPPARLAWLAAIGLGLFGGAVVALVLGWALRRRRLAAVIAGVATAAVAVVAARALLAWTRPATDRRPNVVLVTLDTTRADRLGCYGYGAARTPNLDRLARRGVVFAPAVCLEPLTGPSHASIMTSRHPVATGVVLNGIRLGADLPTLAEAFRKAGYATAAFVGSTSVQAKTTALDRGFDYYDDWMTPAEGYRHTPLAPRALAVKFSLVPADANDAERPANVVTDQALRWLSRRRDRPFFMWVHYFDPHDDYLPPAPYVVPAIGGIFARMKANRDWGKGESSPALADRIRHLYDGELAFMDAELGRLLAALGRPTPAARTIVLVTADHGEAFDEHGTRYHGFRLYGEEINIPFIVCDLGGELPPPAGAPPVYTTLDVAPTLLNLAGIPIPAGMAGRALWARADAALAPAPYSVCIPDPERPSRFSRGRLAAWTTLEDKLILPAEGTPEYYYLAVDPGETMNVAAERPDRVAALRGELERARAALPAAPTPSRELTPDERRKLRALGYVR